MRMDRPAGPSSAADYRRRPRLLGSAAALDPDRIDPDRPARTFRFRAERGDPLDRREPRADLSQDRVLRLDVPPPPGDDEEVTARAAERFARRPGHRDGAEAIVETGRR